MRRVQTVADYEALRDAIAVRAAGGWSLFDGSASLAGLATDGVELSGGPTAAVLSAGDGASIWRVVAWEERGGELRVRRWAGGRLAGARCSSAAVGRGEREHGLAGFLGHGHERTIVLELRQAVSVGCDVDPRTSFGLSERSAVHSRHSIDPLLKGLDRPAGQD